MTPRLSTVHQTMPSEYQDENAWLPRTTSVLWTEKKPSVRLERLFGVENVPGNLGCARSRLL